MAKKWYHGTYHVFDTPDPRKGGDANIFWITPNRKVAEEYANPHWKPKENKSFLWEYKIKSSARILDLRETDHPHIQQLMKEFEQSKKVMQKDYTLDAKDWIKYYAEWGMLSYYGWVQGWIKSRKYSGVIVDDSGTTGAGKIESMAVFHPDKVLELVNKTEL